MRTMRKRGLIPAVLVMATLAGCATAPSKMPDYAATVPARPVADANPGAIYQPGQGMDLFADTRAHRVGDVLTVVLLESTSASKTAATDTAKDTSVTLPTPTILGGGVTHNGQDILGTNIADSQKFSGKGDSSQDNTLTGNIAVTVTQVLPNGNLIINGEKLLTLNQGTEKIRISGIVRPQDIQYDDTVLSTKVADARIVYTGSGAVADSNSMGWLARFFNSSWWPF